MRASSLRTPKRGKERPVDTRALREKASCSQEQLARMLGTSWISVSRWERRIAHPSPETESWLRRLGELMDRIGAAVPDADVPEFLQTPQPLLRGYRPVDLLGSDYSFEDLLAFVDAAKSGDMA